MNSLAKGVLTFHGREVRESGTVMLNEVTGLVKLGKAVAIEYECDKYNGGGDGTRAVYRHEFGPGAVVAVDQTMKRQVYIIGSRIRTTDAGIEG